MLHWDSFNQDELIICTNNSKDMYLIILLHETLDALYFLFEISITANNNFPTSLKNFNWFLTVLIVIIPWGKTKGISLKFHNSLAMKMLVSRFMLHFYYITKHFPKH